MQRYEDEPYRKEDPDKPVFTSVQKGKTRDFAKAINIKGLAASSVSNVKTVLTKQQLQQCADAYTNNGIVRTAIDKSVFFIQGDRSSFVIEPNDELTAGATDQERLLFLFHHMHRQTHMLLLPMLLPVDLPHGKILCAG